MTSNTVQNYYKDEEDFRHLIVEGINTHYAKIDYLGFNNVILHKQSRYVNATKLCREDKSDKTPNGKRFDHWLSNNNSIEILEELFLQLNGFNSNNIPSPYKPGDEDSNQSHPHMLTEDNKVIVKQPTFLIKGGSNVELRGTYVHPDLLPHILCWLSPSFGLKISKIVNMYAIKEKQDKIFSLEKLNEEMKERHRELMSQFEDSKKHNAKILSELEDVNQRLEESHTINERNEDKLTLLTEGIKNLSVNKINKDQYCSQPLNKSVSEVLVISTVHYIQDEISKRIIIVNRCQRRSYKTLRNRVINRFFRHQVYTKQEPFIIPRLILEDPNVVTLWATYKYDNREHLSVENSIITIHTNGFKLITSLYDHAGVKVKPVDQLMKEYEELLSLKDDDESNNAVL